MEEQPPRYPREITPDQALRRLMDQCAKSEKASGDIRRSLYRWRVDPSCHDQIIDTLIEQRFIDDRRFAMAYVREKANLSHWGIYKIRTALRTKQIATEIITQALEQLADLQMEEKLEVQLRRKMGAVKAKNYFDLRGKLLRYGTGLGFDYSEVVEVIDKLIEPCDPNE